MLRPVLLALALVACNGRSSDDTDDDDDTLDTEETDETDETDPPDGIELPCGVVEFDAEVAPLYLAGPDWNDWVQATQSSRVCAPSDEDCDECYHGGEFRQLQVFTTCDCDSLSASDSLGVFGWNCSDAGGGRLEFTTTGFRPGRGLGNLLEPDGSGFKPMSVVLKSGEETAETEPAVWWDNPVVALTDAATPLDQPGAVYVATVDLAADLTLAADGVALVTPPGVTQTGAGAGGSVVTASGVDRVWIEGSFDATGDSAAITLSSTDLASLFRATITGPDAGDAPAGVRVEDSLMTRIGNIELSGGLGDGVHLADSAAACVRGGLVRAPGGVGVHLDTTRKAKIGGFAVVGAGSHGVHVEGGDHVQVFNLLLADHAGSGLQAEATADLRAWALRSFNGGTGVWIGATSPRSVVVDVLAVGADGAGVRIDGDDALFAQATVALNAGDGVHLTGEHALARSVLSASNGGDGLRVFGDATTLSDLAVYANDGVGARNEASGVRFAGLLRFGDNAAGRCVDDVVGSGLTAACANEGSSSAAIGDVDLAASFVGRLTVDEPVNTADTDGAASYEAIDDWILFGHDLRGWGPSLTWPDPEQAGRCKAGETCAIWDWALLAGDAALLGAVSLPDGDDDLVHTWSPTTEPACQELRDAVFSAGACTTTMVEHAVETLGDAFGNDNGACESAESCLWLKNLGAYQGHGRLRNAGWTDGVVEFVTLRDWRENGRLPPAPP